MRDDHGKPVGGQPVFKDKSDPRYQVILKALETGRDYLYGNEPMRAGTGPGADWLKVQ